MDNQQSISEKESISSDKGNLNGTRQYACPCGKSYLSYPALFTHVKQKHNGKAPGQLIKPAAKNNLKRGRPKGIKNKDNRGKIVNNEIFKKLVQPNSLQISFLYFLIKITKDLKDEACHYTKFHLYESYLGYNKSNIQTHRQTPEFVFVHFLKELGQKLGQRNEIIHGMILLFGLFCSFFDQIHYIHENKLNSSQTSTSQNLPYYANSFVTEYLPKMREQLNLVNIEFFEDVNVIKTFQYIFQWLYQKGYVNQSLKIKSQQQTKSS